jgi:nucleoside-diphosphate-sugar epimerase
MVSAIVTGGAGFVGSHLVDALMPAFDSVLVLDDLRAGRLGNIEDAISTGRVTFVYTGIPVPVDVLSRLTRTWRARPPGIIFDLASTNLDVAAYPDLGEARLAAHQGISALIDGALARGARLVAVSALDAQGAEAGTSPAELRRVVEDSVAAAVLERGLDARIVRLGHCYGPRAKRPEDSFISRIIDAGADPRDVVESEAALRYSIVYVTDAVRQLLKIATSGASSVHPHHIRGADEYSLRELTELVSRVIGPGAGVRAEDSALERSAASSRLRPAVRGSRTTSLEDGLRRTYDWLTNERHRYV